MINSNLLISPELSIKQALRVLNKTAMKALFVIDGSGHLLGSLTDGDIRRALLRDVHLESSIAEVYNTNPIVLHEGTFSGAEVKELFLGQRVELIPILDVNWRITDILAWNDYLSEKKNRCLLGTTHWCSSNNHGRWQRD